MTDVVDRTTVAERQAAARLLLNEPVVVAATNPEGFRLIRTHATWLTDQFTQILGYRLIVEGTFARLYKAGLGDASRPALPRHTSSRLTPTAYAYLSLALAVLLTSREQVLLSCLIADVRVAAAEADLTVGTSRAEQRAMRAALLLLVEWGVLVEDENTVAGYGEGGPDVLLTVRRDLVRHLVAGPLRAADTAAELVERAGDAITGGARHRVRRRLVETPVVYREALDEDDRAWLAQYQRREATVLGDFLGVALEIRAEGVAVFHPELTDIEFPATGTVAQAALLTAAELVARLRPPVVPNARDGIVTAVPIPEGVLEEVLDGLLARHCRRWGQVWVEDPIRLAAEVRDLLVAMGLLAPAERFASDPGTWVLLAAAARYATEEVVVERPTPAPDLFGAVT